MCLKKWRSRGVVLLAISQLWACTSGTEPELQIVDGANVSIEYTLTLPDKTVVDSTVGEAPLSFVQGAHEIIPGLENALVGMRIGETKRIQVSAEDGYGVYDPNRRVTVTKDRVPSDVQIGSQLITPNGGVAQVLEVSDTGVVLDLNHELAGKDLTFDVKILAIEKS